MSSRTSSPWARRDWTETPRENICDIESPVSPRWVVSRTTLKSPALLPTFELKTSWPLSSRDAVPKPAISELIELTRSPMVVSDA